MHYPPKRYLLSRRWIPLTPLVIILLNLLQRGFQGLQLLVKLL